MLIFEYHFFYFHFSCFSNFKLLSCYICAKAAIQKHTHWYQVFNTETQREIFQSETQEGYSQRRLQSCTLIDSLHVPVFWPSPAFLPLSDWTFWEKCCFTTWKRDRDSQGVIERDGNERTKENGKQRRKKESWLVLTVRLIRGQITQESTSAWCSPSHSSLPSLPPPLLSCSSHTNASPPFQQEPSLRRRAFKGLLEFICWW